MRFFVDQAPLKSVASSIAPLYRTVEPVPHPETRIQTAIRFEQGTASRPSTEIKMPLKSIAIGIEHHTSPMRFSLFESAFKSLTITQFNPIATGGISKRIARLNQCLIG
jgi:hypothetical protein